MEYASYRPPPPHTLLTPEQLAQLRTRSNWRGLWLVIHAWGVIFGAMALFALWPNPLTFLAAILIIGARQLGLAVLMHDAAHNALVASPRLSAILAQWFCAYPMLADTDSYRRYHLKHHAAVQQSDDPDLVLSAPFPITRKSMRRKLWRDISGQTGFQQRKAQIINALGTSDQPLRARLARFIRKLGRPLLTHLVLLGILAASGYWFYFFLFWLLPLLTWQQLVTRVRNIAEHAMVPDNNDPFRNARTTKAGWISRAFIAPYWVNYHVEHHLLLWVSCYRLPLLRRFLEENGHGERIETAASYRAVLRLASSRPDSKDRPGNIVHDGRRRASASAA
ncbi:MAG: fatty acid desaturase family protein [Parvularculales bacterium]